MTNLVVTVDATTKALPAAVITGSQGTTAGTFAAGDDARLTGRGEVSATEFGAVGDGVTDDTQSLQAFIDHLTANGVAGVIPAGTYLVTSTLDVDAAEGWSLRGAGMAATTIMQAANNAPILRLGVGAEGAGVAGFRMWSITDLCLRYSTAQPSTSVEANALLFVGMAYQIKLDRVWFYNGYYGIKVQAGQVSYWGATLTDLYFNKCLTGGAINNSEETLNGIPNNHYGRLFVEANEMVGPIFDLRGYNCVIDSVEIIYALLSPKLFQFWSKSRFTIGAIKLERATYTAAQVLIDVLTQADVSVGQLVVSSTYNSFAPASGQVYLARVGAGGDGAALRIGVLECKEGAVASSYAFGGNRGNKISAGSVLLANGWKLTYPTSTQTAEMVDIPTWRNRQPSINKGDASYTVVAGDPTVIFFETALTAPRTVTLPSDAELLIGGLEYVVVSSGAVNGANTLTIVSADRTIATITAASHLVRVMWRRNATGKSGWTLMESRAF